MKKIFNIIIPLCLIFSVFTHNFSYAGVLKWLRIGKYQTKVVDSGDQGESAGQMTFAKYYFDGFVRSQINHAGYQIAARDWTDEHGTYWPVKISGAGHFTSDEITNTMPVPDDEGMTIHKYVRFQPASIIVDGFRLDEPFPLTEGDEVNPDKIPGTADVMVESWINTSMGLTIHQRVFAWSQINHDEYIIFDYTFTNTGNVDLDDEIELQDQTLNDVYFSRANNWTTGRSRNWNSCYGEYPGDSLRISYGYPQRSLGSTFDDFGDPKTYGLLRRPFYSGEAMLHVDKSVDDHSDDPSQPQMTGDDTAELVCMKHESGITSPADDILLYKIMQFGFQPTIGTPYMEGTYPGTHHVMRMDEQDIKFVKNFPWWTWRACIYTASGPFTLKPGDSFRIVWSTIVTGLSVEKAWEVGKSWLNGTCKPPEGCVLGVTDNLPPQYKKFPELYAAGSMSTEYNNWAKDCWVATGKDSLFQDAWAAQWNCRNDYNVPIPPPAPSVEIASKPDKIEITWGTKSESASDFAGYRIYRAVGAPDYYEEEGVVVGKWVPIFECGEGTANALTHSYDDMEASRGLAYFYYVAAFDDGLENIPGAKGKKESLESGMYLNQTTMGAYLTKTAGTLSTVRIVPNPFNIGAKALQYPGEENKIMFMDIPGYCTIKIYTESGDLVKTLHHTDGSGDEAWGDLWEEHSATEIGQLIVSGIYIALIEENDADGTPTGNTHFVKFVVVR